MDGGEILTAGKAVLFFALPLGLAVWELVGLKRERRQQALARTRSSRP